MLGLDGQLHPAPRVGDQLQQPFQGEDGGRVAVLGPHLPVGLLVARVPGLPRRPRLPGAEVEGRQVGQLQLGDRAAAVGRTVDAAVVDADEMAVRGQPYVAFEGVRTVLDRLAVRGQGVLGGILGSPAVGDDLNALLLPCVGHRVMVPSVRGTRPAGRIAGVGGRVSENPLRTV
jgi:hypothetical protein